MAESTVRAVTGVNQKSKIQLFNQMRYIKMKNKKDAPFDLNLNSVQLDCRQLRFHIDETSGDRTLFLIAKENINVTLAAWEEYQHMGFALVTSMLGDVNYSNLLGRTVVIDAQDFKQRFGHQGTAFTNFRRNLGLPLLQ